MRRVLALSAAGLAAGVLGALAARTAEPPRAALPPQASVLPADASFIVSVDLRRLVESPLYKRFSTGPLESRKATWAELERRTGLDPERDLTQLVAAGSGRTDDSGLALLLGRFERSKVETALGNAATGSSAREYSGRKLWLFDPRPGQKPSAVTVLEDGLLVAGSPAEIEAAIDRHAARQPGVTSNAGLLALVAKVDPKATFWMCGDQGLLSTVGGASSKTAGWTIPAVKTFVASGDLEPDVATQILAQTADEASAKSVSDMLRGLLSMMTMQSSQTAAVKELASGIEIAQLGPEVKIAARFSYDTLARLSATARPTPVPTAEPAPTSTPAQKQPQKK